MKHHCSTLCNRCEPSMEQYRSPYGTVHNSYEMDTTHTKQNARRRGHDSLKTVQDPLKTTQGPSQNGTGPLTEQYRAPTKQCSAVQCGTVNNRAAGLSKYSQFFTTGALLTAETNKLPALKTWNKPAARADIPNVCQLSLSPS